MRIVGISGAHGGGKTELLRELGARGYSVDNFKVSRAVQAELGWESLERVMDSPDTMTEFQLEVWKQKTDRDGALASDERSNIMLTERTFADICAYSCHWGWRHADAGAWDEDEAIRWCGIISRRCFASQALYAGVVLLPYMPDVIKWDQDSNRAEPHTVDTIYEDIERFMQSRDMLHTPRLVITAKSIGDRADQVIAFLESLK